MMGSPEVLYLVKWVLCDEAHVSRVLAVGSYEAKKFIEDYAERRFDYLDSGDSHLEEKFEIKICRAYNYGIVQDEIVDL